MGLLKFAFFGGIAAYGWKSLRQWQGRQAADDRGPVGSSGIVRDAGPDEQEGIDANDWDLVDEQIDESFPASDPPGRGVN